MSTQTSYPRINIYLDDPSLRVQIKIAAARHGTTISAYCLDAIRDRLSQEGLLPISEANTSEAADSSIAAARSLDQLRQRVGIIGIPVRDLIAEGRRR